MIRTCKICAAVLVLWLAVAVPAFGQDTSKQQVLQLFEKMRQAYSDTGTVQFEVTYTYANESKPNKILDSAKGYMEIGQHGYYCKIDNTETIQTDSVAILLFHDDMVMYLSKKNPVQNFGGNPMVVLDSFLQQNSGLTVSVTTPGRYKNITLGLPPGYPYKKMAFIADTATSFISQISYTVKTEKLLEDRGSGFDKSVYDDYALVVANFSGYKKGSAGGSKAEPSDYFIKNTDGIKTTEKYKDYSIFIATPNL